MHRECRERFSPPPTSKETASWRSRHASRHVRDARTGFTVVGLFKPSYVRTHYKRPRDAQNGTVSPGHQQLKSSQYDIEVFFSYVTDREYRRE